MKPRVIVVLSLVVVIAGFIAWKLRYGSAIGTERSAQTEQVRNGSGTADVASGTGSPGPSKNPAKAPEPVPITTSVMPGMPMVRSTPMPPKPADPALKVRGIGAADARPAWQVEGTTELGKVQTMLRDFRTRMGENPVGSNAEIMKAVMGGNRANARLGPPPGQTLNEQGELVDPWGTPYFFHQLSRDSMEIRSAGPDRKMWTIDDLVSK